MRSDFSTSLTDGVMIGNPPYGERIGEIEEIEQVISELGHLMRQISFLVSLYAFFHGKL